ncbi:hypothetical protein GN316_03030 [Xylophilus sp. Kf1]|nr:hypothetical protein [Xylophilus sp. Kf1]
MAQVEARSILAIGTVLIAGYVVWRVSRAASGAASAIGETIANAGYQLWDTAGNVASAVNPTNPNNVIYSGVNSVGGAVTGTKDWSLGSAIYDWMHPEEAAMFAPPKTISGGGGDYQGNGASGSW